jgi:hypothetical protein
MSGVLQEVMNAWWFQERVISRPGLPWQGMPMHVLPEKQYQALRRPERSGHPLGDDD